MSEETTTASFGYWMRRQRMALDLTQAALARQVGCATVTISKIERDERRPSRQMAELLADHLAIPEGERERFLAVALGEESVVRVPVISELLDTDVVPTDGAESQLRFTIPSPTTPFIGRAAEIERLCSHLQDPSCQLLSLVGSGGFGKTRLAIRLGEIFQSRDDLFVDGVLFVPLEGLERPDLVVSAIAAALHLTVVERQEQKELLLNFLSGKQMLIILDNAEQILEAHLVDEMLSQAPQLKVLITSREALNLQQEWFFAIDGMTVEPQTDEDTEDEMATDALQLFDAAARRARPDFNLENEKQHVLHICRSVDGVPLAIELAASWLKVLPCSQITRELDRSLDLLSTTMRNIPDRHRSMRAILENTWTLLTEDEQRIFRQLSIFVDGFRYEAAQSVADASLMVLASLVEKSVVQVRQDGRYRIHALLQQFGEEKLAESSETFASLQLRHSNYYLSFLAERARSIIGPEQQNVFGEIEEDFDNVRTAWDIAAEQNQLRTIGAALPTLYRYLWTQGRAQDGEQLMNDAEVGHTLDSLDGEDLVIAIRIRLRRAQLLASMGQQEEALALTEQVRPIAQEADAFSEVALCYYAAGMSWWYQYDRDNTLENLNHAYRIYKEINEISGTAQAALNLGYVESYHAGDYATARERIEEGLRLFRQLGDISSIAQALDTVSVMDWFIGKYDEAELGYRETIRIAEQVGNREIIARGIGGLGLVAWGREEWALALDLLYDRLERMQEIGYDFMVQENLNLLCAVHSHAGQYDEAVNLIQNYNHTWRNFFTAEAHIGVRQFQEAMAYLPEETESHLNTENLILLASCMLPWAMLLMIDCPLTCVPENGEESTLPLTEAERQAKAIEILTFLLTYHRGRCDVPNRARALLRDIDATVDHEIKPMQESDQDRLLEELAKEMLTIRLG